MKPDGVATAALGPMETSESNPVNEATPGMGENPVQAANLVVEEMEQQPVDDTGKVEPQPEPVKETPAAKTSSKTSGDPKAKTSKATPKSKPGPTSLTKSTSGPKSNTSQSRLSNGVSKPQTNGVAKKTASAPDKKSNPTLASSKKPTGTAAGVASKVTAKVGEKKGAGDSAAVNGAKSGTGATAIKKTLSTTTNGVKTSPAAAAAAKKPPAPRPASATPAKPSSSSAPKTDKPAVSKTTRSTPSSAATSRPSTGSARPPTASTAKSSTAATKSATPKTSATSTFAASKSTSTTPSGGKPPASQVSRNTTPVKKDATKPSTPAAKKPTESPLTRPSSTTKPSKPETPKSTSKSDANVKKPAPSKAADAKTPSRSKAPESKPTPSKDVSKTPGSKTAAKTSGPKKTVGSSTPTGPIRAPKSTTTAEPVKETAAVVAAAAAIAAAASTIVLSDESETPAAVIAEPIAADQAELMSTPTEPTVAEVEKRMPETSSEPCYQPISEPLREPSPEPICVISPNLPSEQQPPLSSQPDLKASPVQEPACLLQLSAEPQLYKMEESVGNAVPSLGTTVMSPPCSPTGPVSPARQPQDVSSLLDMHAGPDPWDSHEPLEPSDIASQSPVSMTNFQTEEEKESDNLNATPYKRAEDENLFLSASATPGPEAFKMMAEPQLSASPMDYFIPEDLRSPHEKEVAVEKADEEINEDDDEEDEDEEQRRQGHQPSSVVTDMSTSQPSEEFPIRSSGFSGSAGWHGDDLLSGMDSEDMSSCTSSRQQGVSDVSSTQHTAILEGTQSSDALIDSSLRGSEGDGNLIGSPNVETLANEEDEDDDEEDDRVDEMDLSSEKAEDLHYVSQHREQQEDEDEDVEMHSEGVTESCGNVDEDDFNDEERLDNLCHAGPRPYVPPASSWGETNPFTQTWAEPASLPSLSSSSPISDHGAAESETPTQSPAQALVDSITPPLVPQSEQQSMYEPKTSAPEETQGPLAPEAVAMSQSSTLSGTALVAPSSSETSTPEELRDYDSSSGVESRSDKQQTPVPASVHPDMEQDLGIHLEKGDGEEEEAETLPADEVLGTGPPTAPASAPSSPSTSGDEASDTEGEMQINDPDAPMMIDESTGFESNPSTCNLPALDEDEEAGDAHAREGEEDGGGATPQSANSVASYGFDCTTSNSNAPSMAESCGKSPGIFSLENEEHLPDEAKDPSLIKELTLPSASAAAHAEDLLGRPVDLMPLGFQGDKQPSLDDHHYMFGGKTDFDHLEEVDPMQARLHLGPPESGDSSDSQPPYYSTTSDKTDSFLEGDEERNEMDEAYEQQMHSREVDCDRNDTTAVPIANGHYLALVPGNRRPIDPAVAAHFAQIVPPLMESNADSHMGGEQLRKLVQHQEKLREMQHRQEQERQKRQWLEEEHLRLEQQKQLEKQRRELLQLQLQQQQQEHRHRRQVLQWQLELEQQYRMHQKHMQQQQQLRRSPTGVMVSPSSGLCTIYEAMETSEEEEDEASEEHNKNRQALRRRLPSTQSVMPHFQRHMRPVPPQDLEWNRKVDMVQQLINQTLMLSSDGGCPPLLLLPVGPGGTLNQLESSMWPHLLPQFSPPAATVTSVSSYSPDSQGSSPVGDWTVVEVETKH